MASRCSLAAGTGRSELNTVWSDGPGASELTARLNTQPRARLIVLPTPLHRLDRLSAAVGREIWIKRDDLVSVGLGGNKMRKLEYLAADARRLGADTMITVGAIQSNHARCVASVASMLGLECHLVLGGQSSTMPSGNLLLDHLLGAHVHFPGTDEWAELEAQAERLAQVLRQRGRQPYVMPIGGSTPVGALGFAGAYLELRDQCREVGLSPASIVHATSSGGTQAGLELARAACGDSVEVLGVGVAKGTRALAGEVTTILAGCSALLDIAPPTTPVVTVLDGYRGPAYAVATPGALDALIELLRLEGILTDPVYTAKALHAVLDPANTALDAGPVVFWHTGGVPAVFAPGHGNELLHHPGVMAP